MKLLYLTLPLLGSLAIAQSLIGDSCQCPQVKCPASDTIEGCRCVNLAELRCKRRCPNYRPTKFRICSLPQQVTTLTESTPTATPSLPILGFPTPALPIPDPPSDLELPDLPLVPGCECEEMMCIQSYPASCHCAYGIAMTCYTKCGGKSPGLNTCPPANSLLGVPFDGPVKRVAAPEPEPVPQTPAISPVKFPSLVPAPPRTCKCQNRICIQSWPASCLCENANKYTCWKRCGGVKPALKTCSPIKLPKPTPIIDDSRKIRICGGGRASTNFCPEGYTCVDDPFKTGCGLACDGTGICAKNQMCGGFAGFRCPDERQVCVDSPLDGCDPNNGGADCGGVCVWPLELRIP